MAVCSSCESDHLLHLVSNVDHYERVNPTHVLGRLFEAPRRDVVVLDIPLRRKHGHVLAGISTMSVEGRYLLRWLLWRKFRGSVASISVCMLLWRTRGVLDSGEPGVYTSSRMAFPGGKACFSVDAFRSPGTVQ